MFAHFDMKLTNMVLVDKSADAAVDRADAADAATVVADAKTIADAVFRRGGKEDGKVLNLELIDFGGAATKLIGRRAYRVSGGARVRSLFDYMLEIREVRTTDGSSLFQIPLLLCSFCRCAIVGY